jgi:hypothetical protein
MTHQLETEKQVLRFAKKLDDLVRVSAQVAVAYRDWVKLQQRPEITPIERKPEPANKAPRPALSQAPAPAPGQSGRSLPAHRRPTAGAAL